MELLLSRPINGQWDSLFDACYDALTRATGRLALISSHGAQICLLASLSTPEIVGLHTIHYLLLSVTLLYLNFILYYKMHFL